MSGKFYVGETATVTVQGTGKIVCQSDVAAYPTVSVDAQGYPMSWSSRAGPTLRKADGTVATAAGTKVSAWYSQETGTLDARRLVTLGTAEGATLVQDADGVWGLRSPGNHIFTNPVDGQYYAANRVISYVFSWWSGMYLFCFSRPREGTVQPELWQASVDTPGTSPVPNQHNFGAGGRAPIGWDNAASSAYISNAKTPGERQVMTVLVTVTTGSVALIVRNKGQTFQASWTTNEAHIENYFTGLQIGGRNIILDVQDGNPAGRDADLARPTLVPTGLPPTLYEVYATSPSNVPATLAGVNAEYERLCTKWGVTP
jgi:hypothetical protein